MYPEVLTKTTPSPVGPTYSLLELLMHELSNPVQAARTTLHLLEIEGAGVGDLRARVQNLSLAFERISSVIQTVQSVKESALLPATTVTGERLLADLRMELASLELTCDVFAPTNEQPLLLVHEVAVPLLIARWAALNIEKHGKVRASLLKVDGEWTLKVTLRKGQPQAISREMSFESVAGYPAALGEFMRAADGRAFLYEDDLGAFELILYFST